MKIVGIFGDRLFSFHYNGEEHDELKRILDLWNDTEYLFNFLAEQSSDIPEGENIEGLVEQIIDWANEIEDLLYTLSMDDSLRLETFFKPLHNQEQRLGVQLSKQKGRRVYLRLYALKVDADCFAITGGAIKFTHLMEAREHTRLELQKLSKCRAFLQENDVFDSDSFFEFLNEV